MAHRKSRTYKCFCRDCGMGPSLHALGNGEGAEASVQCKPHGEGKEYKRIALTDEQQTDYRPV